MSPSMKKLVDKWAEVKPLAYAALARAKGDPEDQAALEQITAEIDTLGQDCRQIIPPA